MKFLHILIYRGKYILIIKMLISIKLLLLLKSWFFYESFFAKPQTFLGIIVNPPFGSLIFMETKHKYISWRCKILCIGTIPLYWQKVSFQTIMHLLLMFRLYIWTPSHKILDIADTSFAICAVFRLKRLASININFYNYNITKTYLKMM